MAETHDTPAPAGGPSAANGSGARSRRLILCFDGTGNIFSGSNADTNVVKLLNKLDRSDPHQFHYYQTGIGTYDVDSTSVDQSWLASFRSSLGNTMDQGFGAGFDAHVLAGYRFLMRYYESGDKIYMFGFSRGAFTAKFLARMIHTVGLLCKGNEEMVPFAYRLYQRQLAGEVQEYGKKGGKKAKKTPMPTEETSGLTNTANGVTEAEDEDHHLDGHDEIAAFSNTFCRKEQMMHKGHVEERNIKVYFLGMWDCVSSVAVLEQKAPKPVAVSGTAQYVRHAVAVDERRVKFKVALLAQDIRASADNDEDIKEVWFPGCHGDVGGGWPASLDNPLDTQDHMTFWQRVTNIFTTRRAKKASKYIDSGPFQMSDIPLAWMIHEVELVGKQNPPAAVSWRADLVERFNKRFQKKKSQALGGFIHDSLRFGHGTTFSTVLLWKFLEWFPFTTRWELEGNDWVNVRFPLNGGAPRDIPPDAVLHGSLLWRLRNDSRYHPLNNHGGKSAPCLKYQNKVAGVTPVTDGSEPCADHQTYVFAEGSDVG